MRDKVSEGKRIVFLKVDNGSDWDLHLVVNELYMYRLWKVSGLDILGVVSYSARYSAYNNIEHLWSPMSKKLNSVVLPSVLEGESEPPCKQTGLTPDERRGKEALVFDKAMDLVTSTYWAGACFNDSEVVTNYRPCLRSETPFHDYKDVHALISGSLRNLRSSSLCGELRSMFRHIDRKSNEVIFRKCALASCDHCGKNPPVQSKAWNFMKNRDFKWHNPVPSPDHPNHYMTFLEASNTETESIKTGDVGLPYSLVIGSCPYCPSFAFFSPTEKERHLKVFHHNQKGDGHKIWNKDLRCLFVSKKDGGVKERCNLVFKNENQLREHKRQAMHMQSRKKETPNQPEPNPVAGAISSAKSKKSCQLAAKHLRVQMSKEGISSGASDEDDETMQTEKNLNQLKTKQPAAATSSAKAKKPCKLATKRFYLQMSKKAISSGSRDEGDDEMVPTKKNAKIHQRPQRNATFARYRFSSSSEESE